MTKTLLAALALALASEASAQSRTLSDSAGRVVGRSSTDSSGTITKWRKPTRCNHARQERDNETANQIDRGRR